jgi:hypothetical protein
MKKNSGLLALVLSAFIAAQTVEVTSVYSQSDKNLREEAEKELREKGRAQYGRSKRLKDGIQEGWPPGNVIAIMGQPEERRFSTDGSDDIEIWYYDDFDVRIVFRNGRVSAWNMRFIR